MKEPHGAFYADLSQLVRRRDPKTATRVYRGRDGAFVAVYSYPGDGRVKVLPWYDESGHPSPEQSAWWRAVVEAGA